MQTPKKRPPRRKGPKSAQLRLYKTERRPPKPTTAPAAPLFLPGQGYLFGAPIDGEE